MKKLFSMNMDATDYLLTNNLEKVAETAMGGGDFAKTASVHSTDERSNLDDENVALIMYHPHLGEMRKFACDTPGMTELNLGLLSQDSSEFPEELIKIAANNLGYVASHYNIKIPENLQQYSTGEWLDPRVDITHINKVAYYTKLNENENEEEITKTASVTSNIDKNTFNEDIVEHMQARISLTHNEDAVNLYQEVKEVYKVIKTADSVGNLANALYKGMIKSAEDATFNTFRVSWLKKLAEIETPFLSPDEKEALLGEEGEEVFESLPAPTKERIRETIGNYHEN